MTPVAGPPDASAAPSRRWAQPAGNAMPVRLVSAGRTNRQIAEVRFISPKTAVVHVSNILAKLEVSGRGEAAAVAHRLGLFPPGADRLIARQ